MRVPRLANFCTTLLIVAVFSAGCSKSTPPAGAKVQKLGEIALVPQTPKHLTLDEGKELVITATVVPDGEIQLNLEVQPRPTDGSMHPFEQGAVLMRHVRSGKEYDLPVGDELLRFTPRLKTP